ncbi:transmembrane reductase CYB561D2 [Rhynchophorus ferrugineus]|uniref:transmembrane reductase CYB561D2 n=1 Tax=Rhynchophorus ferrugineus TaxID=354439 RepID=UPI003FCC60F6
MNAGQNKKSDQGETRITAADNENKSLLEAEGRREASTVAYTADSDPTVTVDMANYSEVKVPVPKQVEKPKKKKEKGKKPILKPKDVVTFRTHLTSLAHISVVVFVYVVIKLAFRDEFVLFTWHPILMSFGWMLMMTEGLYAINKYNTYWRFKTTGGFRVQIHWIALAIGYALSVIGFAVVYINKDLNNKHHFATWHGLFGLIGLIATVPPIINGTVLYFKKELSRYIDKPRLVKFIHVITGTVAFLFGALAIVLSVYSNWYRKRSTGSVYLFWLGLVSSAYPLFWAVYGPSVKLYNVIKDFFSNKED